MSSNTYLKHFLLLLGKLHTILPLLFTKENQISKNLKLTKKEGKSPSP